MIVETTFVWINLAIQIDSNSSIHKRKRKRKMARQDKTFAMMTDNFPEKLEKKIPTT